MLSIEYFSLFLSVGILATLALVVASAIGYAFSAKARDFLKSQNYSHYLKFIGFLSITGTLGALTYQFAYDLPVCVLCWWQRIFIFPIDIVILVSLFQKARGNHVITGILALIGSFFAGYHYYYHFIGWVMKQEVMLPCTIGGLLPSCTDNGGVLTFGFITIPFMALVLLISVVWLSFLAHKSTK